MGFQRSTHVPLRFTALLLCVLSLFGHLGAVAHQLFEEHVVCAEHGDLIHAGEAHASNEPVSQHASWRARPGPAEEPHDHCWAPAHRDDDCDDVSAAFPTFDHITPRQTPSSAPAPVTWLASVPVISLAPKQSPPRSKG
jgi:hypothetical protein